MADSPLNSQNNNECQEGNSGDVPENTSMRSSGPEPPLGFNASQQPPTNAPQTPPTSNQIPDLQEFQSVRRMVSAAQIMALVSLVIGGVILSGAALIVAILAYRKTLTYMRTSRTDLAQSWQFLRRSCIVALIMAAVALLANGITLVLVYPTIMQMVQSGDLSSYLGMGTTPQVGGGSSSSFWG